VQRQPCAVLRRISGVVGGGEGHAAKQAGAEGQRITNSGRKSRFHALIR
jgi:hypothetical protein